MLLNNIIKSAPTSTSALTAFQKHQKKELPPHFRAELFPKTFLN